MHKLYPKDDQAKQLKYSKQAQQQEFPMSIDPMATTQNEVPPGFAPTPSNETQQTTIQPMATMTTAAPEVQSQPASQPQETQPVAATTQQTVEAQPVITQPVQTVQQPQASQPAAPVQQMQPMTPVAPVAPVQQMQPIGGGAMVVQPMAGQHMQMQPMGGQQMQPAAPPAVNMASLETDIDDNRLVGLEYFGKLNKDQVAIVTPLLFKDGRNATLLNFNKFFLEKIKKDFLAPTHDAALMDMAITAFGQATLKPTTFLLVYQYMTDNIGRAYPKMGDNGQPVVDAETGQAIPDGKIVLWRPSKEKISPIRTISQQFGLMNSDIILKCEEDKYQKYTIQPTGKRMLNAVPAYQRELVQTAERLWKNDVAKLIPKNVNAQTLQALINENMAAVAPAPQQFGAPQGMTLDPFAAARAGNPAPAVGMGGGVATGGPVYTGTNGGVAAQDFGDMLASATQSVQVG